MTGHDIRDLVKTELCSRFANYDECVEVVFDGGEGQENGYENSYKIHLYTENHVYNILAIDREVNGMKSNYLGCTVSTRKPRAGETWNRGNDLTDGNLTLDTWNKIKNDIISYELVKLAPKSAVAEEIKILQDAGFK